MSMSIEGYPVLSDFDSFWKSTVVCGMDGAIDEFEEIDDDFLSSIPLDFPKEKIANDSACCSSDFRDSDSGIDTHDTDMETSVPDDFAFPFKPYDIQIAFMQNLYKALELSKIGIFESPTGTGKSLSLICGALTWLKDYEAKQKKELVALLEGTPLTESKKSPEKTKTQKEEPDWITAYAKKQESDEAAQKLKDEQEQILKREARLKELRTNLRPNFKGKRKRERLEEQFEDLFKETSKDIKEELNIALSSAENGQLDGTYDDEVLVEEYHSDDEKYNADDSGSDEDDNEADNVTKIYYCSRTHSQLAQFVREVQKSPFGEDTQVVSLGSRQNLCINEAVKRLKSGNLINDRCLELQKHKSDGRQRKKETVASVAKRKKSAGGCPFYKQEQVLRYRDRVLVEVRDIEQLVSMGKQMKSCPYYGTRLSIPTAQLVALPYNTLLHKSTRKSCGIKLKGNIVIIDEAHNLVESISNVHSVEITGAQITCAHSQLSQYLERYRSRLKAKNLMYIRQVLFILSSFVKCLGGNSRMTADKQKSERTVTRLQTINDFLFDAHLDNLNLFKVLRYCERSMISKKLLGFVEKYQPQVLNNVEVQKEQKRPTWALSKFLKEISENKGNLQKTGNIEGVNPLSEAQDNIQNNFSSPLMHLENFMETLTNTNKDGRILINKQELLSQSSLKFLLLNPAVHFADVLQDARAVIVAGGTMQPLSLFKDQLFFAAGVKPERILEYSCGHVIPEDHLLPIALARGSSGLQLDFTYQSRDTTDMMDELGRVMYNVCNMVSGGIVCFFPSYEYEKLVYTHWESTGFLQKMQAKKKVFREPKKSSQVDQVLGDYSAFIKRHLSNKYSSLTGAVLLSVVGGKVSEGINFSDDLGRCIVMVGLPYPNLRSPELKEKMDYLNAHMPKGPDGKLPGQQHYENICMKAVNQSIGRAIRHKDDYATILLLDHRYLRRSIRTKLPGWIAGKLQMADRFGPAFATIRKFFAEKAIR